MIGCRATAPCSTGLPVVDVEGSTASPEGTNQTTLETLLSTWHATLRLCQFDVQPMVKPYGTAFGLSDEDLNTAAKQYNELLASFAA